MRWFDVDGARRYLAGGDPSDQAPLEARFQPSRKFVYGLVADGLRVARVGDTTPRRDAKGRLRQGRMHFCAEWIDQFLTARSTAERGD